MPDPPPAGSGWLMQTHLAIPSCQDHFDVSLPEPLTSFIGRKREIATISALVRREGVRLVTLTGPGGVGKTRLALRVAGALTGDCTHDTAFVDLATVTMPENVAPAIAAALGVREVGDQTIAERLVVALRDRPLLLVLDNFEQVVEAASLVVLLLHGCPRLKVLATTRTALRLSGERVIVVEPLALPDRDERQGVPGMPELMESEAIALFVDRAQGARTDFTISAGNAPVIAEICRRVDGLPLAIELAAARISHLPAPALLARLEKRLPLLTGGPRDLHKRQRTLRETIAWSHDLLVPEEQILFRRLAVFAGGFHLEAASAVVSAFGDLETDVLDGVTELAVKSLLREQDSPDGEPRFTVLETIREYALERLAESGEEESVRRAHAAYFLDFAESESSGPGWPGTTARVAALEREDANLRAALRWAIERGGARTALRLVAALGGFWRVRARLREGRAWSERVLALAGDTEPTHGLTVEVMLGWFMFSQGDVEAARATAERALSAARVLGDAAWTARALGLLGCLAFDRGDPDRGTALLAEAEVLSRQADDRFATAVILYLQGVTTALSGGDQGRSIRCYEESLALWRDIGDIWGQAVVLSNLAGIVRHHGDSRRAAGLEREALAFQWALGAEIEVSYSLLGTAESALAAGHAAQAARLAGVAARLHQRAGAEIDTLSQAEYDDLVATIRTTLGEAAFAAAWASGAVLPLAEVVAEADAVLVAVAAGGAAVGPGADAAFGLSPREREVLRLVAAGHSNREIAEALFISLPTAKVHVRAILTKLGLDSRTAAAAFAIHHGLS